MIRDRKMNEAAFSFCLAAEIERMLARDGATVKADKNITYYKQTLAFTKVPISREKEYLRCASEVTDALADMERDYFNAKSKAYTVYHASGRRASGSRDGRDLIFTDNKDDSIGVSLGRFPSAQDRPAIFYAENENFKLLDISNTWFGTGAMSMKYIDAMNPVCKLIANNAGKKWSDVFTDSDEKYRELYLPILAALKAEIEYQCDRGYIAVQSFVKHFFGVEDYYLVSLQPDIKLARVSAYGLNGKLAAGQAYSNELLPTELIDIRYKEKAASVSSTTLHLTFDNGWTMNMRLRTTDNIIRSGPRLEVDFKDSMPYKLRVEERYWK